MRTTDVAAAVIKKEGKYLIARRKEEKHLGGKWEFPGGKINEDETAKQCLERELEEELGIAVKIGNFIAEGYYSDDTISIRLLGYLAELISGQLKLNAHDEIRWVKAGELMNFDFAEADLPIVIEIVKYSFDAD